MNASSPRSTNGSYTVPTGSSGWPDRSQASPSCPSSRNRFISLMPSSMCCPSGPSAHFSTGSSVHDRRGGRAEHPHPVDEPGQVGRGGHVGRRGDQVGRHALPPGQVDQNSAERFLGGQCPAGPDPGGVGDAQRGRGRPRRPGQLLTPGRGPLPGRGHRVEPVPLGLRGQAEPVAHLVDLLGGQQRGVVARVARDRQPPALDRVDEHHTGPVLLRVARGEASSSEPRSCPARSVTRVASSASGMSAQNWLHLRRRPVQEPGPQLGPAEAEQRLVVLVGHGVDPVAELRRRPAGRTPRAAAGRTWPRPRASRPR